NNAPVVLRVLVWGTEVGGLDPTVVVTDSHGNVIPADVLVNESGSFVAQVPTAVPNVGYYVRGGRGKGSGSHAVGAYLLGGAFSNAAVSLPALSSGTLSSDARNAFGGLQVTQTQLFHFALSVGGASGSGTGVQMVLYDQSGAIVASLTALSGDTQTLTVLLK